MLPAGKTLLANCKLRLPTRTRSTLISEISRLQLKTPARPMMLLTRDSFKTSNLPFRSSRLFINKSMLNLSTPSLKKQSTTLVAMPLASTLAPLQPTLRVFSNASKAAHATRPLSLVKPLATTTMPPCSNTPTETSRPSTSSLRISTNSETDPEALDLIHFRAYSLEIISQN